jgi:hypothetical protein
MVYCRQHSPCLVARVLREHAGAQLTSVLIEGQVDRCTGRVVLSPPTRQLGLASLYRVLQKRLLPPTSSP